MATYYQRCNRGRGFYWLEWHLDPNIASSSQNQASNPNGTANENENANRIAEVIDTSIAIASGMEMGDLNGYGHAPAPWRLNGHRPGGYYLVFLGHFTSLYILLFANLFAPCFPER